MPPSKKSSRKRPENKEKKHIDNPLSASNIQTVVQETIKTLQGDNHIFKEFLQLQPPKFEGSLGNEDAAEEFIAGLENVFQVLDCLDDMKVKLATFRLRKQAREWWKRIETKWTDQGLCFNWDQFVEAFYSKYRPNWMCEQNEIAFLKLKQDSLTVPQYEERFLKLSKYCERLIDTEELKIRKFIEGLRHELQTVLAVVPRTSYDWIVERAVKIELCQIQENNARERTVDDTSCKTSYPLSDPFPVNVHIQELVRAEKTITLRETIDKLPAGSTKRVVRSDGRGKLCHYCRKSGHVERECRRKTGCCIVCGDMSHFAHKCPRNRDSNAIKLAGKKERKFR